MTALRDLFSNREIALYVWMLVLAIWAAGKPQIRKSAFNLVGTFLGPKILLLVLWLCLFTAAVVAGLRSIALWDLSLLKDTLLWIVGAGIAALVASGTEKDAPRALRQMALELLTVAVVLEFVLNLYSFPLWLELVAVPLVTLAVVLKTLAEYRTEHRVLVKPLDWLLASYTLAVLAVSGYQAVAHFAEFASIDNLRSFILPIALSLAALPYLYLFALVVNYEQAFLRLRWATDDVGVRRYARLQILRRFHFRLGRLQSWNRALGLSRATTREEFRALLDRHTE